MQPSTGGSVFSCLTTDGKVTINEPVVTANTPWYAISWDIKLNFCIK